MTAPTIADLIRRESRAGLKGRARELSLLETMLREGGPAVAYVHGPSGIGKTALLRAFEATLDARSIDRLRIAAGAVEPRPGRSSRRSPQGSASRRAISPPSPAPSRRARAHCS